MGGGGSAESRGTPVGPGGTVGRTGWAQAKKPEECEGRRWCRRSVHTRKMHGRGLNTTVVCLQSIYWDGSRVPGAQGVRVLPLRCVSAAEIAETSKVGTSCSLPSGAIHPGGLPLGPPWATLSQVASSAALGTKWQGCLLMLQEPVADASKRCARGRLSTWAFCLIAFLLPK